MLLSGDEPFNGIIYPILKAMRHFKHAQQSEKAKKKQLFANCHLVLGATVLDAPMVAVIIDKDKHELAFVPWVRVIRHQTDEKPIFSDKHNVFAIDIVHKDFLPQYINEHALPFSKRFSDRADVRQNALLNCKQEIHSNQKMQEDEKISNPENKSEEQSE